MRDEERKSFVARVFDDTVDGYDRFGTPLFAPLGRRLVEVAEVVPGASVLDVATGTGAVLVPAAEAAGAEGYVLGIDLSAQMVRAAASAARRDTSARVETRVMDAEHLDHLPDGEFDAVLCGCGVSFFPHPERAVAEFLRVLRPGGTVGVSRWSEADPRWDWYPELLRGAGAEPRALMAGSPDPQELLASAGFTALTATAEPFEVVFADERDWWDWLWAMPYRAALEALDAAARERFRTAAFERVAGLSRGDGIHLRAEARYVIGRKPG